MRHGPISNEVAPPPGVTFFDRLTSLMRYGPWAAGIGAGLLLDVEPGMGDIGPEMPRYPQVNPPAAPREIPLDGSPVEIPLPDTYPGFTTADIPNLWEVLPDLAPVRPPDPQVRPGSSPRLVPTVDPLERLLEDYTSKTGRVTLNGRDLRRMAQPDWEISSVFKPDGKGGLKLSVSRRPVSVAHHNQRRQNETKAGQKAYRWAVAAINATYGVYDEMQQLADSYLANAWINDPKLGMVRLWSIGATRAEIAHAIYTGRARVDVSSAALDFGANQVADMVWGMISPDKWFPGYRESVGNTARGRQLVKFSGLEGAISDVRIQSRLSAYLAPSDARKARAEALWRP